MLELQQPSRDTHEPTWCVKLLLPYFHLITNQHIEWAYHNNDHYGAKRADFLVQTADAGRPCGLAVVEKGIDQIKTDMKRWKPHDSPAKICIAIAEDRGPVYYVMLSGGLFVAVHVRTWVIPTAFDKNGARAVATAVAMAKSIFDRIDTLKAHVDKYKPYLATARQSILGPASTR
ncbi:hypothetical protein HDU88_004785 [Geranomyces variabilis]|nr:hypothetical protein HDU88_004785 [Geranomyces variabilis]